MILFAIIHANTVATIKIFALNAGREIKTPIYSTLMEHLLARRNVLQVIPRMATKIKHVFYVHIPAWNVKTMVEKEITNGAPSAVMVLVF